MKNVIRRLMFLAGVLAFTQSALPQGEPLTFSVTGDIPDAVGDLEIWQQQVIDHNKYSPSEFMLHVGDVKGGQSSCPESGYIDFSTMTKQLKVPFFIVPGDNDYNDCSNPAQAKNFWFEYFMNFENNSCCLSWPVERQTIRPENFAFIRKGILFIGISDVGQRMQSAAEWNDQLQQDADWVNQQFQDKNSQVRGAVIFTHVGPMTSLNLFYSQFEEASVSFGKQVLLIHGHGHSWVNNHPFDAQNITRIQVDNGGAEAPLEVTAKMNASDMWVLHRSPFSGNPTVYNAAPCVDVGPNQSIDMPQDAYLRGRVSDDGDPEPASLSMAWSQVSGPGTVTFANANDDTTTATFSSGGVYILRLTASDGALQASDDIRITANVLGPMLSIDDITVNEDNSGTVSAAFTVTLSNANGANVTVDYSTADGTAVQPDDYSSIAGTLSFFGATTTRAVTVPVNGDVIDEPDETFFVNLFNASGAAFFDDHGQCTIIDDDASVLPSISSFTPASGAAGTQVTITGSNFIGVTNVMFNLTAASSYVVDSEMQIRATVQAGASSGKISVTASGGTVQSATDFTVISGGPQITVTSAEDAYVKSSTPTTSFGTASNLRVKYSSTEINNTYLKFNVAGVTGPVQNAKLRVYCSDTGPDGGSVYAVSNDFLGTTTPWVQSTLNWNNAPEISGSPLSSLGAVTTSTWFEFNVTAAVTGNGTFSFAIKNNNSDVVYYHAKEGSNDPQLVIDIGTGPPSPIISSFLPASGVVGAEVTISGNHFDGVNSVKFNNAEAASYVVDSPTQVRATVPTSATTGKISVTASAGSGTSANNFTVVQPAPTIASFTPPNGIVGSEVTITGSNFTGASNVKFNTTTAPTYTVDSATQLRATVPTGAASGKLSVTTVAGVAQSIDDFTVTLPPAPTVASFNPTSGIEGATITIAGTNFIGATSVKFNDLATSTFTVNSATEIVANVPIGATNGPISVTNTGGTGASVDNFTVLPSPPAISSFTPTSGPATTVVTIVGSHFSSATVVQFNGMNAASFTVMSATQVQAEVPVGATSGKISVTAPGGSTQSATDFTVTSGLPQVTVTPAEDAYVKSSTPTTSFGTASNLRVKFSSTEINNTYLKFNVTSVTGPVQNAKLRVYCSDAGLDGGGVYPVSNDFLGTTTPWVQSTLTWNNAPAIAGAPLSSVAAVANNNWVEFDVTAAVTSNGTFSFAIKNNNSDAVYYHSKEAANDPQLVIDIGSGPPSPVVSSFTPASGVVGIEVTISGNHFTDVSSVKFNNVEAASYVVDSVTQVRATVPASATTGKVSVTASTGTGISPANFTVIPPAPAIASFNPTSALVGIEVTITGANFIGASLVKFNVTTATVYTIDSATQIRATVPAGATTGKVSVTTPGGMAVSIDDFTVILPPAPSISSFTPTSGPTGTQVTITGGNFTGASSVKFNDVNASAFVVDSDTQIRATVSASATTGKISVTTSGGTTPSVDDYTVTFPSGTTVTFNPTDDAYVRSAAYAATNYGTASTLRVRKNGTELLYGYLKFNVSGLSGSIQSARLRLKVVDAGDDGGSVYLVSNDYEGAITPWNQTELIFNNAPSMSGTPLASIGAVTNGTFVEIDVASAVTGNGIYSFGIKTSSSNAVHYNSREASAKPELVIQTTSPGLSMAQSESKDELKVEDETADGSDADSEFQRGAVPKELKLSFAYPNPFNAQTSIEYGLPEEGYVRLMIFNTLGQSINILVDEKQTPGYKRVLWNGRDRRGLPVSSGIYLYTLEAGHRRLTGKVVFQQ